MALSQFMEIVEQKVGTKKEKVMLIDGHNLIFRTVHVANYQVPEDESFSFWKYLIVNSLLTSIKYFKPTKVIFAIDSRMHWRKNIYADYKVRRKLARKKSTIDFKKFYPIADSYLSDLSKAFSNMCFLKIDECEGDDIIAILAKYVFQNVESLIISADKDMIQLLDNKKVKLWDPMGRKYRKSINPKKDLILKCIMGDKSDDIPAIKPKVGIKTAAKIYTSGLDEFLAEDKTYKKNYKRNCRLIDFDLIPVSIRKRIENAYKSYQFTPYNGGKVWQFLLKNRIKRYSDDLQAYSPFLKNVG